MSTFAQQFQLTPIHRHGQVFVDLCMDGRLLDAQWVLNHANICMEDVEGAFHYACEHGHLDVAQWLHSIGCIDVHERRTVIGEGISFLFACEMGNLNMAQWLYSLGTISVVIDGFKVACRHGHLEMAQWLYGLWQPQLGVVPTTEAEDNMDLLRAGYRKAFKHHHTSVVEWLVHTLGVDPEEVDLTLIDSDSDSESDSDSSSDNSDSDSYVSNGDID